jgi:ribosomal protein S18 acetylase RimI-like enzyme
MSQAPIELRPFAVADARTVVGWLRGPGLGVPPGIAGSQWAERLVREGRSRAFVAWQGDQRIAFARLDMGPDRVAELTLAVSREHRRQGIGRRVLGAVLEVAQQQRARRIQAVVDRANTPAMRFFAEAGFEERPEAGMAIFVHWLHGADAEVLDLDS